MMRKLMILLLVCTSGVAMAGSSGPSAPEAMDKDLWNWSCDYMRIFYGTSCKKIEPPKILWTEFRWTNKGEPNLRMLGLYWHGSPFINVNVRLAGKDKARHVIVHESIHYIIHENNLEVSACKNEEIARRAHHAFEGTKYKDDWKTWYNCVGQ